MGHGDCVYGVLCCAIGSTGDLQQSCGDIFLEMQAVICDPRNDIPLIPEPQIPSSFG